MLTLFRVSVYDNAVDVMYLVTFGCDVYPDNYLYFGSTNTHSNTTQNQNQVNSPNTTINSLYWCLHPETNYILGPIFFILFAVIASFVVLSLFVGAISLSMTSSLRNVELNEREKIRQNRFNQNLKRLKVIRLHHDSDTIGQDWSEKSINKKYKRSSIFVASNTSTQSPNNKENGYVDIIEEDWTNDTNPIKRYYMKCMSFFEPDLTLQMIILKATLGNSLAIAMGWKDTEINAAVSSRRSSLASVSMSNNSVKMNNDSHDHNNNNDDDNNSATMNNTTNTTANNNNHNNTSDINKDDDIISTPIHSSSSSRIAMNNNNNNNNNKSSGNSIETYNNRYSLTDQSDSPYTDEKNEINSRLKEPTTRPILRRSQSVYNTMKQISHKAVDFFNKNNKNKSKNRLYYVEGEILGVLKSRPFYIHYYLLLTIRCHEIVHHKYFAVAISAVIITGLVVVGIETAPRLMADSVTAQATHVLDILVLTFFVSEIILKIISYGFQPWIYFSSMWNVTDLIIVIGSFIPDTHFIAFLFRMLQLQRLFKLVNQFPQLSVIVNALGISFMCIGYVGLMLSLFFYVYAILGVIIFALSDPWHFGSLHIAALTLFRVITLDSAFEIIYTNFYGCQVYPGQAYTLYPDLCDHPIVMGWLSVLYFLSFIILAVMILLTLFIGVISSSLESAQLTKRKEVKVELDLKKHAATLRLSKYYLVLFDIYLHTDSIYIV